MTGITKIKYSKILFVIIITLSAIQNSLSNNEYLLFYNGINNIKLGMYYNDLLKYYKNNKKLYLERIDSNENEDNNNAGIYIYENKELIISINNRNYGHPPYIVEWIKIHSNKYKTNDGICVGMKLSKLLQLFPSMKLKEQEEGDTIYCFEPPAYQKAKSKFILNINIYKFVKIGKEYYKTLPDIKTNIINNEIHLFSGDIESIDIISYEE
jgi:hypothetical protein